jgi:hypothetical protein
MSQRSIFADEWRDCLREHYMYVIREQDNVTRPTLTKVMLEAGFSDEELAELRVRATIRADEMPEDFVPDMDVLEAKIQPVPEVPVMEVSSPEEVIEDEPPVDELVAQEVEEIEEEIEEDDPDQPQQLSLF